MIQALPFALGSDSEDMVWITVLVFAIFGAGVAIWSFVKKKPRIFENEDDYSYYPQSSSPEHQKWSWQTKTKTTFPEGNSFFKTVPPIEHTAGQPVVVSQAALEPKVAHKPQRTQSSRKNAYLKGGLELLETNFLLNIVNDTKPDDKTDATIRKICFQELMRREQLYHINSNSLKVYSLNKNKLYGKKIQCAALQQLALRTGIKAEPEPAKNKSENATIPA